MLKILIFRTDRIGDLIVTCPSIISLKNYSHKTEVTLVTSSKNYEYAKSLNFIDHVIKFPKNSIIDKIKFFYALSKKEFNFIFVFDGKERSILTASLIKSKIKVALASSIKIYYKFFKIKFFTDIECTNLNVIFQKMINYSGLKIKIDNYDFIKKKKDNYFSKNIPINKYIHIHLDEKWFNHLYIHSYTNINPNYIEFITFLNEISKHDDIIITTGLINLDLVNEMINKKDFEKIDKNIFFKKKFY